MTVRENPHLNGLQEMLAGNADQRYFTTEEYTTAYMYTKYLVNLMEDAGYQFRGESFKYGVPLCLLVVKGVVENAPMVCFINALSRLNAYKIFLQRLEEGTLEWRRDQYA